MRRTAAYAGVPWLRTGPVLVLFQYGALCLAVAAGSVVVARAPDRIHAGRQWQDLGVEARGRAPLAARRSLENNLQMSAALHTDGLIGLHRAVVGNLPAQALPDACHPG